MTKFNVLKFSREKEVIYNQEHSKTSQIIVTIINKQHREREREREQK